MVKIISKPKLLKELKNLDQAKLIDLVFSMYEVNDKVKEQLSLLFLGNAYQLELVNTYKRRIQNEFLRTSQMRTPVYKLLEKSILEIARIIEPEAALDLLLYYAESADEYTNSIGGNHDKIYDSICNVFSEFATIMFNQGTRELNIKFKARIEKLQGRASDIGWGYGERMSEIYSDLLDFDDESD